MHTVGRDELLIEFILILQMKPKKVSSSSELCVGRGPVLRGQLADGCWGTRIHQNAAAQVALYLPPSPPPLGGSSRWSQKSNSLSRVA